jgi:predicted heme/steroid binding protein
LVEGLLKMGNGKDQKPKCFSEKQLSEFDGKEGRLAYVAFKGKVYNVSGRRLWIDGKHQELHSARADIEHANFLFTKGASHLKQFISALKERDVRGKLKLNRLFLEANISPVEVNSKLVIDLREPWDLKFLYKNHPQGEDPEFYEEILSLIDIQRSEAQKKGWLDISDGERVIKIEFTTKGFLVYKEGQSQPEVIGPITPVDD